MTKHNYFLLVLALFCCPALIPESKAMSQEMLLLKNAGPAIGAAGRLLQYPIALGAGIGKSVGKGVISMPGKVMRSFTRRGGLGKKLLNTTGNIVKFPFQLAKSIVTLPFRLISFNPR